MSSPVRGSGVDSVMATKTLNNCAGACESQYAASLRKLMKRVRPSVMAATMDVKSSSSSTITAASRAASLAPGPPMATPIWAALRAGASFVPVIALRRALRGKGEGATW